MLIVPAPIPALYVVLYVESCGELIAKQLSEVVVPVSTPPLTRMPFASRALAWKPRKC